MRKANRKQEEQWIDQALAGDTHAFSLLYKRYYQQVYAFCIRMLHGQADPEDTTQQVFLEAWRSLHRFEKRSLFSTWVTRITIHTCLSLLRRNNRLKLHIDISPESAEKETEFVWIEPNQPLDEQLARKDRKKAIYEIIKTLTPKKKTVFILSDMQGMTAPEIARILKIPDATVRTRLFHARREFQDAINRNMHYKELLSA
ncbi:MAG: RNA polymerase sigma factor [Deltaproteobacteria bacterium]|nr:RNA polymerase sigma factor [Deltaproteobacteria bacterium]